MQEYKECDNRDSQSYSIAYKIKTIINTNLPGDLSNMHNLFWLCVCERDTFQSLKIVHQKTYKSSARAQDQGSSSFYLL